MTTTMMIRLVLLLSTLGKAMSIITPGTVKELPVGKLVDTDDADFTMFVVTQNGNSAITISGTTSTPEWKLNSGTDPNGVLGNSVTIGAASPRNLDDSAQGCHDYCYDTFVGNAANPTFDGITWSSTAINTGLVGFGYQDAGGASGASGTFCVCYLTNPSVVKVASSEVTGSGFGTAYCFSCESNAPSSQPSSQPSGQPSGVPSENPSSIPSSMPSGQPSSIPSSMPSGQPSSIPSENPSSIPSSIPSGQPSSIPSENPSSIPSSMPSGQPSSIPSENPSGLPSGIPSEKPSSMPSENPSGQPSGIPSENPSGIPSSQPSGLPSSIPSQNPSSIPSSIPSGQPSSMPSENPSRQPSSIPSGQPSSIPSEMPSGMPSTQPSEIPSSQPSEQPSGQPSETPSVQPSCTPSMAPTDPETTHLFYPNWSPGGEGCNNDGNQPNYMNNSPSWYMFSTAAACCKEHFSWNYDQCIGNVPGICARSLFYPDWTNNNDRCVDDGNEPQHITNNAMYYMFSRLEDCCREHFDWDYENCVGFRSSAVSGLFYPDWNSLDYVCRNDGNQPQFMNNSPGHWMHGTLVECCKTNFQWKYDNCVGSAPTPSANTPSVTPPSNPSGVIQSPTVSGPVVVIYLWYPDWAGSNHVCRNDGGEPPYMSQNPTLWMYSQQKECCIDRYSWNYDVCMAITSPARTPQAPSQSNTTPVVAKFYKSWVHKTCVQDCDGAWPCGGQAQSWDYVYDTLNKCCDETDWYNDNCKLS